MPLLLICGPPGSGKTNRADLIQKYFKEKYNKNSIIINEENLHLIKEDAYKDSVNEKMTRGFLKSNVEKTIQTGELIIFDSMNYIKGFRYEIFCITKAMKTTYCLLYLNVPQEKCQEQNNKRENKFSEALFLNLFARMEVPKQKDRWDSPYFEVRHNEEIPFEDIYDVLFNNQKSMKEHVATKLEKKQDGNHVQEQERKVQEIIDKIIEQQNESISVNGEIKFDGTNCKLYIKRPYNLIELKKVRLEFTQMLRVNPIQNNQQIPEIFINYLQNQLQR